MNYLERYRKGEYEQVWGELLALGAAVREEPHFSQARAVAHETMGRVRRNCERLVERLGSLGYVFGTYPDRSKRYYSADPLTPPSEDFLSFLAELEGEAGPLPISLTAFWQQVGAVDFVGMHPDWGDGLDPLVVEPPEGALAQLYDDEEQMFAALAPDDLHKDNVSGGDPYGVMLPDASADFPFLYESHNLHFVPYLRFAILRWGGFPGLEGSGKAFEALEVLTADLEPF